MQFQNNSQEILQAFLQHDNETRKQAENYINNLKDQNFEGGFQFFINGLQLENQDLASLAALLFKKKYFENLEDLQKIPTQTFEILIQNIKQLIAPTKNLQFMKRLSDILVQLLTYQNQFNEIMVLIDHLNSNVGMDQQNKLKQLILYMIEIVCEYSFDDELLIKYSNQFSQLFEKYLQDQDITVRVSAMKTMTTFLVCISDETFLKKFEMVFPVLLKTSVEAIQIDEEAGKSSLESLAELIETQAKFTKPIINDLINLFTEIISAQSLNEQLRSIALNGLVILSVKNPSLVRKSDLFKQKTIPAIIMMMSEINKVDISEWNEELQDNVVQKNDPSSAAQDALGKITPELGSKFMLPNSIQYIKQFLVSSEWPQKFAALMAISMMTEGAQKHFASELDNFMSIIIPLTNETDPRMQWAVLTTFAFLCSEYTPDIQVKYHEPILKFILQQLQSQYTKLQLRATQSIINFCQELLQFEQESQVLIPYADGILSAIQALFNKSLEQKIYILQEEILNAISMISVTLESQFANYYNSFMPGLKQLLINLPAETQQQINIRVLTIECLGFLLSSIKNTQMQVFQDDLKLIMDNLIQLQKSGNLSKDDAHHQAILSVYSHLASCLKEKFSVYLPFIIDELLRAYQIDVEFTAQDTIEDTAATVGNNKSKNLNIHQMAIDLKLFGGKKILSLNTSALEQKIVASQALSSIAMNLGQAFYPYCQQSSEVIVQFMSFINSKEIRTNSLKTVFHLLKSCQNEQQMAQIFNPLLPKMLVELQNQLKFENHEDAFTIFDEINKCIKLFQFPSIEKNSILELLNCTTIGLRLQDTLKKDLMKRFEEEQQDCDDDQKDQFEDDYEDINNLMQVIMDISGKTVQLYKDYCEAIVVNNNLPFYYNILNKKTATDNEVLYAVCIFDEILEFCSEQIFNKAFPEIAKIYLDKCKTHENYDILQSIYFGFGVFATRCSPQLFQQFYIQICQSLVSMIEQSDAFSSDKVVCTECAISSIGKIALFQPECQGINRQDLITNFLKLLPLKNEQEEAQNTHLMLLKQVQAKNQILIANESAVLQALTNIKNIDFSNPECEILNNEGKSIISQLIQ